jgi:hypothetical protein
MNQNLTPWMTLRLVRIFQNLINEEIRQRVHSNVLDRFASSYIKYVHYMPDIILNKLNDTYLDLKKY